MSLPQCICQAGHQQRIVNETTSFALAWRKTAESACKLGKLCTSAAGKLSVPASGFDMLPNDAMTVCYVPITCRQS